jgi:type IV pilus assembly protein PilC
MRLHIFLFQGINSTGLIQGRVAAQNKNIAIQELHQQGILVRKIRLKRNFAKAIKSRELTTLTRQLASMIKSGISLLQALNILIKGQANAFLEETLIAIKKEIENGFTLAQALKKHPQCFSDLYCNLLDAGEKSGTLDLMLHNLANYQEKMDSLKRKIKKALLYPSVVLVIAFSICVALLTFVVPQFESLFHDFGVELPFFTRKIIDLSLFIQNQWVGIFIFIGLALGSFLYLKKYSRRYKQTLDTLLLKLPILGNLIKQAIISRISRTLAITFSAGLPILEALQTVAMVANNIHYTNAVFSVQKQITSGLSLGIALENTRLFPPEMIHMIAIGEESGTLELMLYRVADFYEEAVDNALDQGSTLLEPLMMILLGFLVGGLILALYLPVFQLGSIL